MNGFRLLGVGLAFALLASGCGGQDRGALATKTVQDYWVNVDHMKLGDSYKMMTPGNRQKTTQSDYSQSMVGLLRQTGGLTVTTGTPKVNGDVARVPITLHSPKTTETRQACQHLYWENDHWSISDEAGGLSPANLCSGNA